MKNKCYENSQIGNEILNSCYNKFACPEFDHKATI